MTNTKSRAVIISPTYNERPNIKRLIPVIDRVFEQIEGWDMKLLVVDDSSPDGTADEVRQLQKKYKFVELLVNPQKCGLGGAYLKGMDQAFNKLGAEVVFELDADMSHDPKKIPAFLREIESGADMVLGSRYISGGSIPANWGLHRKFLSVFGNFTIALILGSRAVRDWTTGYRAIRRSVYEKVHEDLSDEQFSGYTFQIGFLHKALRSGFKVTEVPFHFIDRTEGVSKLGTEYIVNTLRYILIVRLRELLANRLIKFVIVGGIGFMVNLIFYHLFKSLELWTGLRMMLGIAPQAEIASAAFSDESLAVILGAEVAIISNYLWNNLWTFKDRKIVGFKKHLSKFLQFNLGSVGSVVIQYITMQVSVKMIGIFTLLTLAGFQITSDNLYLVAGVLLGMVWNFTVYSRIIWRKK